MNKILFIIVLYLVLAVISFNIQSLGGKPFIPSEYNIVPVLLKFFKGN